MISIDGRRAYVRTLLALAHQVEEERAIRLQLGC
jgi:hypothetical protein